jgi:nickel transport protein
MLLLLGLGCALPPALAHELEHSVVEGQAVVVSIRYPDGRPFSYERYEVHRVGDDFPYASGRTDPNGRLAFLPDAAGTWLVRAFSEDGHGLEVEVASDGVRPLAADGQATLDRPTRILVGLSLLFGLFGLISLWAGWRRRQ